MANCNNVKRGFYELLQNAQARTIKTTTIITKRNHTTRHIKAKYKNTSHYNILYKSNKTSSSKERGIDSNSSSKSSSISGSSSCSQSLSLFYFSCYSPSSIITFITTTICCYMRNVYNLCWKSLQQRPQQQKYKIKNKTCNNSSATISSSKFPTTSVVKNSSYCTSIKWYFFLWLFLSILGPCISLTMTEVRIPKHIMRYETAALGCKYDLDGESLYSVKWYKDGFEFYRYVPRDTPPGQMFPLPGVDVDLQNSTDNIVVLNRVTLQSTGRYRCEVSGEAPSFQTVSGHEDMIVVVTPLKGPQITGGQPRYSIGEKVSVNCTSAPSKPICHLSWLVNGIHANRSYLRYYEPKIVGREGLEVATLGLEFRVRG